MNQQSDKIRYFLYTRKSSESEEKQVASIESQLKVLKELAKREGIKIIGTFSESHSAKAPGRPIFNEMMSQLAQGKADGILCWKLDRLARNPIDGGQIIWMLQQGIIKHIRTYDRNYLPTDNVLMMNVEFGVANQFILDLRANTRRGVLAKCEKGWFPGLAPLGYLNNKYREKGRKDIMRDPERFDLVKKVWMTMLTGKHSAKQLCEMARGWGLRGKRGEIIQFSKIYEMFNSPFYYGEFDYAGHRYKGAHEPMITKEQFEMVRDIIEGRSHQSITREFDYTGLMMCGECGGMITAHERDKKQKNGNIHHYTYYHCTKKKGPCSQPHIRKKDLEPQIKEMLANVSIRSDFYGWAIDQLRRVADEEVGARNKVKDAQQKAYNDSVRKIDRLIEMRMNEEIVQEEFMRKKEDLLKEKEHMKEMLEDTDLRVNNWLEKAEAMFELAENAVKKFESETSDGKKAMLKKFGLNLVLKDKILDITPKDVFVIAKRGDKEFARVNSSLEPPKTRINKEELAQIYTSNPVLGA